MISRRIIILVSLIAAIVCLNACHSSAVYDFEPEPPGEVRMVTLDLSVNVLEGADPASRSRAFQPDENPSYEGPATDYEKLKTLRVVIVRPDGTIEHNRMVTYNEATGLINHDNLKFEVISNEMKKIYLFGNEKIVRQMNDDFDFGTRLAVGKQFPTATVNSLTLKMEGSEDAGVYSSKPVINNSYYTGLPTYIPMSECFDIMVNRPAPGTTLTQEEELFITRSLIKFSFCVDVDTRFQNGTVLDGIVLSGLADESFYMPHETNYDPKKYEPSYNPLGGRLITSFETLNPVHRFSYTFPVMPGFDMSAEGETPEQQKVTKSKTVEQYVYFPESKDGTYKVRLLFTGNDELTEIAGEQTLEIEDIPRNTHVKVNISFEDRQIKAIVDLLPYTAVDLNPSFGF